ncbi:MAG: divalent metal cation transporter [Bacteroidetes bacterium]|nr:MAG: divalent metal cation transporter [Bacteroidota bacterium]
MAKSLTLKSKFLSVLFWSIISAAFIGPGTITTAASAGASFKEALVWALVFATIATVILQEAAARITIASGLSLGEAIAKRYQGKSSLAIKLFIVGAIVFGGAAYQAGNILGATSGIALIFGLNIKLVTTVIAVICFFLLWGGNAQSLAKFMGIMVALMGLVFIGVAINLDLDIIKLIKGSVIPSIPPGSDLIIIGLIGTTIVPYNLFLASGISRGQELKEMRFGITIAVIIGGIISIAILLVGTSIQGEFSFQALHMALEDKLGPWAGIMLGVGLFAAGFTSSITAPLASAITAQSIFGQNNSQWSNTGRKYRLVWIFILASGFLVGISGLRPIPVIIMAQAINGFLLPFITIFLLIIVNDKSILPVSALNSNFSNVSMLLVVGITILFGARNMMKAFSSALDIPLQENIILPYLSVASLLFIGYLLYKIMRLRRN